MKPEDLDADYFWRPDAWTAFYVAALAEIGSGPIEPVRAKRAAEIADMRYAEVLRRLVDKGQARLAKYAASARLDTELMDRALFDAYDKQRRKP